MDAAARLPKNGASVPGPKYSDVPNPTPLKVPLSPAQGRDPRVDELVVLVEKLTQDLQVQFTRIAQLQAEIDLIRGALARVQPKEPTQI
jgi:hypothetical protein